jgi:hypothetical protein
MRLEAIQADPVTARISGSGDLWLAGQTGREEITISGSGKVDATELDSDRAKIQISGSGSAKVKTRIELAVQISGSGKVSYLGDPRSITQKVSGAGRIEKLG